jgi:hypothetical protein
LVGLNFNLASEGEQTHNNYRVQNSHDGKVAINLRSLENNDLGEDECIDNDRVKKQLSKILFQRRTICPLRNIPISSA